MQIAVTDAGRLVSRFFAWWLGELASLVPRRVRKALAPKIDSLCFSIAGNEVTIVHYNNGNSSRIARLALDDQDLPAQRAAVEAILRAKATRRSEIVIALPADQALHKTLDLPLAAEAGIKDLLYFELDRQTPYRPDQVRYDYRIVARDAEAQRIHVEFIVVPKDIVDRLTDLAGDWGLTPSAVTVDGLDNLAAPEFDLAAERESGGPSRAGNVLAGALAIVALLLASVAVYLPLDAQRRAAEQADAAVTEATAAARTASALRDELDRAAEAGNFLLERKRATPMVTAVLADLTQLFPDDTWLFELHIEGDKIRARGYSPAASSVLELVERGSAFKNARFSSPVTRVPGIDRERFDLTFELAREGET